MRNTAISSSIIFGILLLFGCVQEKNYKEVVKINDYRMSLPEFEEKFNSSSYINDKTGKKDFLDNWIDRKLILQNAEQLGLDKKKEFLNEMEDFWEKTLLKHVIDVKSKELAGVISVDNSEIKACYEAMTAEKITNRPYEELYDEIKWKLLREKQTEAFRSWVKDMRKEADIQIDQKLLGID